MAQARRDGAVRKTKAVSAPAAAGGTTARRVAWTPGIPTSARPTLPRTQSPATASTVTLTRDTAAPDSRAVALPRLGWTPAATLLAVGFRRHDEPADRHALEGVRPRQHGDRRHGPWPAEVELPPLVEGLE